MWTDVHGKRIVKILLAGEPRRPTAAENASHFKSTSQSPIGSDNPPYIKIGPPKGPNTPPRFAIRCRSPASGKGACPIMGLEHFGPHAGGWAVGAGLPRGMAEQHRRWCFVGGQVRGLDT